MIGQIISVVGKELARPATIREATRIAVNGAAFVGGLALPIVAYKVAQGGAAVGRTLAKYGSLAATAAASQATVVWNKIPKKGE